MVESRQALIVNAESENGVQKTVDSRMVLRISLILFFSELEDTISLLVFISNRTGDKGTERTL